MKIVLPIFVCASLALAAGLCWLLIDRLVREVPDWPIYFANLSWPWLVASFGLGLILILTGADKWRLWLRAQQPDVPVHKAQLIRHYSWQTWVGLFVPLPLAIIAGRSLHAKSQWRSGAANALWDQGFEFMVMICLMPVTLMLLLGQADNWIAGAGAGIGLLVAWMLAARRWGPDWLQPVLWRLFGYSWLRVGLIIARQLALTLALAMPLSLLHITAAMPVLTALALIPLTPGNLGITEWGWVGVLALAGEDPKLVAIYALGCRVLIYIIQSMIVLTLSMWPKEKSSA